MYYLFGIKRNGESALVAKFGSEQQLQAYVGYATLKHNEDGTTTFEQKTPLTGCIGYEYRPEEEVGSEEAAQDVPLNPTPTML